MCSPILVEKKRNTTAYIHMHVREKDCYEEKMPGYVGSI